MKVPFYKYQGTGNDFIMVDQRDTIFIDHNDSALISLICDRRFGIGGDGLILLENDVETDFKMVYFNADGRQSSMCGNGGRCIVQFASDLKIITDSCRFSAIDGWHEAMIDDETLIHLKMSDVNQIEVISKDTFVMNTGSPHYVKFVNSLPQDVKASGAQIRYNHEYAKSGINVNFVVRTETGIQVATYERGVEDETFSCGTGVVASAISYLTKHPEQLPNLHLKIITKGGNLSVRCEMKNENHFINIWLIGPAIQVFHGSIEV